MAKESHMKFREPRSSQIDANDSEAVTAWQHGDELQ